MPLAKRECCRWGESMDNKTPFVEPPEHPRSRNPLDKLKTLLQVTEMRFSSGDYVLGNDFTVVDATLFTVLRWSANFKLDLSTYKKLGPFMERIAKRPAVIKAMKEEGL